MNIFIYDEFLAQKNFQSVLNRVEVRITDLGLNGKIIRLGAMKDVREAVRTEILRGAKTIIAVGDDATVNRVINAMIGIDEGELPLGPVPFAVIPIGKRQNFIAGALGVPENEKANEILSARRIERLDLGKANDHYFLSSASIKNKNTTLEIDQNFTLEIAESGSINIVNLQTANLSLPGAVKPDPRDGSLELIIDVKKNRLLKRPAGQSGQSVFPFKRLYLKNPSLPLIMDGAVNLSTPATIVLAEKKLPVIVGRSRGF